MSIKAAQAADEHAATVPNKQIGSTDESKPMPVTIQHVLMALRETEEERELRIHKLFKLFDVANVGKLENYAQIEAGLSALGKPVEEKKYAKDLFIVCDANKDGGVDYQDFRRYVDDKEIELYCIFQAIDIKHDGRITSKELLDALVWAGIEIDEEELDCFLEHVAKDNIGTLTFEEWRDFLLFYPREATIKNIHQYLVGACPVKVGEESLIPEDITKDASKYLILGGIAGATSRTATAPLDRIKVFLQVQISHFRIFPAIRDIYRDGGFLGFFRGNGVNVLKVAPETAIKFYTFEMMKNTIRHYDGDHKTGDHISIVERLVAGGTAGAVAQTVIYPMDLVKTRLQTFASESGKFPKLDRLVWSIWMHEGPRAFYRGLVPSLIGIVPFAAIDFTTYEALKDLSKEYIHRDSEPGPFVQVGCGTISGALGASCVYPLQVIRTRMQAQRTDAASAYKGMSDVFWRTLQHEGLRGFYRGILPNLLKVVPSASITYLVFETLKRSIHLE